MPADGSLYFDYLVQFPVGVAMSMGLSPDVAAFAPDEAAQFSFTVTKVGANRWIGVPRLFGAECDTHALFDFVLEMMDGEVSADTCRFGPKGEFF